MNTFVCSVTVNVLLGCDLLVAPTSQEDQAVGVRRYGLLEHANVASFSNASSSTYKTLLPCVQRPWAMKYAQTCIDTVNQLGIRWELHTILCIIVTLHGLFVLVYARLVT